MTATHTAAAAGRIHIDGLSVHRGSPFTDEDTEAGPWQLLMARLGLEHRSVAF